MLQVTCALVFENKKILTTQLAGDTAHPFQWEFPGGKIKPGETAEQCVKRELQEELEIQIEIVSSLQWITFDYGARIIKLIPFLCRIRSGKITLNEHHACRWAALEELYAINLTRADKKLLMQENNRLFLEKHFRKQVNDTGENSGPAKN